MKTSYIIALSIFFGSADILASVDDRSYRAVEGAKDSESAPEIVHWIGKVSDSAFEHTNKHTHSLQFENQTTGLVYDVVDSPNLVKIHHENEKNYIIEIIAEKSPKFLFWGNNLTVKSFNIIQEAETVRHQAESAPSSLNERRIGGR